MVYDDEEWMPGLQVHQRLLSVEVCMSNFLYRIKSKMHAPRINAAVCLLAESCKLTMDSPLLGRTPTAGPPGAAPAAAVVAAAVPWVASSPEGYAQPKPTGCSPLVCNCTPYVRI